MELNYFGTPPPPYQVNNGNNYIVTQKGDELYHNGQLIGYMVTAYNALETKLEEVYNKAKEYKDLCIDNGIIEKELTETEKTMKVFEEKQSVIIDDLRKENNEIKEMLKTLIAKENKDVKQHDKQPNEFSTNTERNEAWSRADEEIRNSRGHEHSMSGSGNIETTSNEYDKSTSE